MKNSKGKGIMKTVLASTAAICICSGVFAAANNSILAMEIGKTQDIPTTYNIIPVAKEKAVEQKALETYVKADYKVVEVKIPISPAPTASALTADEAAEVAAKYLWEMFKTDLNGKTLEMAYIVDTRAKAEWQGTVSGADSETPAYTLDINAITGEILSLHNFLPPMTGTDKIPFDLMNREQTNAQWKNNCDEYLQLAAEFGEKHFGAKIVSSEFQCVSALSNDKAYFSKSQNDVMQADYLLIVALVTDEYGRQCEITVTTNTKELESLISESQKLGPNDPQPGGLG